MFDIDLRTIILCKFLLNCVCIQETIEEKQLFQGRIMISKMFIWVIIEALVINKASKTIFTTDVTIRAIIYEIQSQAWESVRFSWQITEVHQQDWWRGGCRLGRLVDNNLQSIWRIAGEYSIVLLA